MAALELPLPFGKIVRLADAHVADEGVPVTLTGEEPTRDPAFLDVLEYLLRRGLPVHVTTGGTADPDLLDHLEALPPGDLRFVVDAGPQPDPAPRLAFLRRMRDACELRLSGAWNTDDVMQLVEAVGLEATRIHVESAATPSDLPALAKELHPRRITVVVSDEVPLDALTDADLGTLYRCGAVLPG
jgi:hypothetical protein